MKIQKIADRNSWSTYDLTEYAKKHFGGYVKEGVLGATIEDCVAEELEAGFEKRQAEKTARANKAARTIGTVNFDFMTSGFGFEGYRITRYLGMVTGDVVIGTGFVSTAAAGLSDVTGDNSYAFAEKIRQAKEGARWALAKSASDVGANAVIGVDYDVFDMKSLVGFSANGTAVVIERVE